MRAPARDRPKLPKGYITTEPKGMLTWSAVETLFRGAPYFWIATTNADGRPHLVQQWGVWIDQQLFFEGSERTGWARNLARDPRISFGMQSGNNAAYGDYALFNSTGGGNIAVGHFAGVNLTTGSNNIDIGNRGTDGESNTIRIGTTGTHAHAYMAGISNNVVDGDPVVVDAGGQLGIPPAVSSARFKEDIHPMDRESEAILSLQPVTFRYKKEIDSKGAPRFGLIAEEVEKVNPALVTRGPDHQLHTVRYEAINAMLLNEFLKEHRTVEQLKSTVAKQEAIIAQQAKQMETFMAGLKEQGAQLQKVSAQLAVSKPAPQVVNNR